MTELWRWDQAVNLQGFQVEIAPPRVTRAESLELKKIEEGAKGTSLETEETWEKKKKWNRVWNTPLFKNVRILDGEGKWNILETRDGNKC